MINSIYNKNHIYRIIMALFMVQLIHIPIWLIIGLSYTLFDTFFTTEFIRQAELFSSTEILLVGYVIVVSFVVTLVYGLPCYLVLKRFNKASLLNLVLAGSLPFSIIGLFNYQFIYSWLGISLSGAAVAAAFWMVVTNHGPRTVRTVRGVAIVLITTSLGLAIITNIMDAFFTDNLQTAWLKRALSDKALTPEWWEEIENYEIFNNIKEARKLYEQYDRHGEKIELRQRQNREFFKSAFITISDVNQDPKFIVDLVLLMNLPYIEYAHLAQLQWYAFALRLHEDEPRVRLLTALLNTAPINSENYNNAMSLSYDLLTENRSNINPNIAAPLCSKLASAYDGGAISHFELSVFRDCKARLSRFSNDQRIELHYKIISKQLQLMERNLFDPTKPIPSSHAKPH